MHILMILNDPPYGTERTYNGLRLAPNLLHKAEGASVTVFLMAETLHKGDAMRGQTVLILGAGVVAANMLRRRLDRGPSRPPERRLAGSHR